MHVVGGHHLDTDRQRDLRERVVPVAVDRVTVIPQLDQHPLTTESCDQVLEGVASRRRSVAHQRGRNRALATAGEHVPRVVGGTGTRMEMDRGPGEVGQHVDTRARRALLPRELRFADRARESRVTHRPFGQNQEVVGFLVAGRW